MSRRYHLLAMRKRQISGALSSVETLSPNQYRSENMIIDVSKHDHRNVRILKMTLTLLPVTAMVIFLIGLEKNEIKIDKGSDCSGSGSAAAGGIYWQLNFNKDCEHYAYAKGVDALVYAFPYYLKQCFAKWSQPEAPEGQEVPVDAVNKFWHATFVDPKYRDGGAPNADTLYSPAWLYAKEQPIIITVPEIPVIDICD